MKQLERSGGKKQRLTLSHPYSIPTYNKCLDRVDMNDRMVAHYPHSFQNKKLYLRIFLHFMNVAMVNAWMLYTQKTENKIIRI